MVAAAVAVVVICVLAFVVGTGGAGMVTAAFAAVMETSVTAEAVTAVL